MYASLFTPLSAAFCIYVCLYVYMTSRKNVECSESVGKMENY